MPVGRASRCRFGLPRVERPSSHVTWRSTFQRATFTQPPAYTVLLRSSLAASGDQTWPVSALRAGMYKRYSEIESPAVLEAVSIESTRCS